MKANYYTQSEELSFELHHPLMERIAAIKERHFTTSSAYPEAPHNAADAIDGYERLLEVMGEIAATSIATHAEAVDEGGPICQGGRVAYAAETAENLHLLRQSGLYGMILPREYGGLNIPLLPYTMCAELIGAADPSLCNLWSLQDCAQALCEFGTEEQRREFLPRVAEGDTLSMDLTEPDAGSDLQAAMLRATYCEEQGCWLLNGVKRFITNGDADIHLVLARSEEGTTDARGLSLFVYDKRQGGVEVRRIEHKLGVHGSPTCELVYTNAPATLCGTPKMGLIKYVMSLMNCARLGIAAQSVGISQAAYRLAKEYATERKQFGKAIAAMPPVYQMLGHIKARLDASRALLYETARQVDLYKALEELSRSEKLTAEERKEAKQAARWADCLTPLAKMMNAEFAIASCHDALQVYGGSGYMMDYPIQRYWRDARVTNIYEGTTQMQVVAALRYVTNGTYTTLHEEWAAREVVPSLRPLQERAVALAALYEKCLAAVKAEDNPSWTDFCARALVEMAALVLMFHLMIDHAERNESLFGNSLHVFATFAEGEAARHAQNILANTPDLLTAYSHTR